MPGPQRPPGEPCGQQGPRAHQRSQGGTQASREPQLQVQSSFITASAPWRACPEGIKPLIHLPFGGGPWSWPPLSSGLEMPPGPPCGQPLAELPSWEVSSLAGSPLRLGIQTPGPLGSPVPPFQPHLCQY